MALTRRQQRELNRDLERQQEQAARRGLRQGIARVLSRLARRILRLEVSEVAEVMERGEDGLGFARRASSPGGTWSMRWEASLSAPLEEAAVEAGERVAEATGGESLPPEMRSYLNSYTSELAESLSSTSYENVRRVVEEAQSEGLGYREAAQRLREREPDMTASRADLIVSTEVHRVSVASGFFQAKQAGATHKEWGSAEDDRVRETHRLLDGTKIPIDQEFGYGEGRWPAAPRCRCVLYFSFSED